MSSKPFYEQPILNSPYHPPTRHHALDEEGRPLDRAPMDGRRRSKYVTPVPKARRRRRGGAASQAAFDLDEGGDGQGQGYNPAPIINEIRRHLEAWRASPVSAWGVTPTTAK
ncbi:MAG: restriction endonuclease, partial [bacterium]